MKELLAILALLIATVAVCAQERFSLSHMTNATHTLQVETRIPGFPHPNYYSWHFVQADQGDGISPLGPAFFPGSHSRQTDWRVSLIPKGATLPGTNLLYRLTWRIQDFESGSVVTNQAALNMPLGKDFAVEVNGVMVEGKWKTRDAEQSNAAYRR